MRLVENSVDKISDTFLVDLLGFLAVEIARVVVDKVEPSTLVSNFEPSAIPPSVVVDVVAVIVARIALEMVAP